MQSKQWSFFLCLTLFFGRSDFLLLFCAPGKCLPHSILAFLYRGAIHFSICSSMFLIELSYFENSKCVEKIRSRMGPWMRGKNLKLKCWLLDKNLDTWIKVAVFSAVLRTWSSGSSHWNPNQELLRWPYFNVLGISQVTINTWHCLMFMSSKIPQVS